MVKRKTKLKKKLKKAYKKYKKNKPKIQKRLRIMSDNINRMNREMFGF